MELGSVMGVYAFLLGLALGSFANVCIYRIPLGRSIASPPSSCPRCGRRIRFYDNIPLLSYALLGGRCRHCRHPIGWTYPLVECLFGLLSLALFIRYGWTFQYALFFLFAGALFVISFIDLRHQIIPDVLSIPGAAAGLAVSAFSHWAMSGRGPVGVTGLSRAFSTPGSSHFALGQITWLDSVVGVLAGGGGLLLVAFVFERLTGKEGMGRGDIKLLAMIGAWMGWQCILPVILISSLAGAAAGSVYLLAWGKGLRARIPFGPFLSLGALIHFFFGPVIIRWYLNLLR
jgi:leader peptidase (prepilin peptidase) / N-methyltransferase